MRHISTRAIQIPPSIDVLLCEQEVVADDTPAVQAILKADVKRTALLEEAEKLEKEQRKGNLKASLWKCLFGNNKTEVLIFLNIII